MKNTIDLTKENKRLKKELTKLSKIAFFDLKFGCNNRNFLENSRKELDKSNLIIVMNDLNGLKKINDTNGHNSGDIYINEFIFLAKKYLDNLQIKSRIIRLSGDEFLILIFDKFELFNFCDYQSSIDNIASCGMTEKPKETRLYFAMKKADKILYNNKQLYYKSK